LSASDPLDTGSDVDIVPDFDGDGVADLVIGAPYDPAGSPPLVYVASGAGSGAVDLPTEATYVFEAAGSWGIGDVNAGVGDVTGDGMEDIAIEDLSASGYLFVVEGGTAPGTYDVASVSGAALSFDAHGGFGFFSTVGLDYDEDGLSDLVVGVPTQNEVYAFLGPLSGTFDTTAASATWTTTDANANLGGISAGVAVGDIDSDKHPDVVIAAYGANRSSGAAYLQLGLASGVVDVSSLPAIETDSKDYLGWSVALMPDWTGDDGAEVMVGAAAAKNHAIGSFGADYLFDSERFY
jgi:hypothetical protein